MNRVLWGIAILSQLAILVMLAWILSKVAPGVAPPLTVDQPIFFTGGCFKVQSNPPPGVHAQTADEFCIKENQGFWTLTPGAGMNEWHSIAGGNDIPFENVSSNLGLWIGYFEVAIDGHPPPTGPNGHGPQHTKPNWQFYVHVNAKAGGSDAWIRHKAVAGGPIHAGSAHADEN